MRGFELGEPKLPARINEKKRWVNIHTTTSRRPGLLGLLETALRRFRNLMFFAMLVPVISMGIFAIGLSLVPGMYVYHFVDKWTAGWSMLLHFFAIGCALSLGFLLYGLTLIFVLPAMNWLMPFKVKPFRGVWYSLPAIPWYIHNSLTYIARYTFLDFITPTPLNVLFYRMMGMKIGKGVVINTNYISDPCMIELGDYVTLGGSATLFAHYAQKGFLVISPVKIGKGTTIGLKASVMGGVTIGKDCNIKPHTAVLPKTVIPDGTTL